MSLANNRKYGLETSRLKFAARTVKKGEVGSKPRQGGSRLPSGSATRSERVLDRPYKQFIFGLPPYKKIQIRHNLPLTVTTCRFPINVNKAPVKLSESKKKQVHFTKKDAIVQYLTSSCSTDQLSQTC
jgi:hypothetical protein